MKQTIRDFMRLGSVAAAVSIALSVELAAPRLNASDDILQRTRAMYAALHSYADTGVVLRQFSSTQERHTFTTYYKASRPFYFDFQKESGDRFVIWSDEKAFHSWWKSTGVQDDYPRGRGINVFLPADFVTLGSALKIPALLFSGSGLQGAFANFTDAALDGREDVGGRTCFRLVGTAKDVYPGTGREVNVRQMTVWVDAESLLIRKVLEDSPKGTAPAARIRTTTTFEPRANPPLDDSHFQFAAPASK